VVPVDSALPAEAPGHLDAPVRAKAGTQLVEDTLLDDRRGVVGAHGRILPLW
jgi:hypothetical protein